MSNAINWFEIPASDFDRAVAFYSTILDSPLHKDDFMGTPHGFFAGEGVNGAVIHRADTQPGGDGPVIYLNADGMLDQVVARVEPAGGRVLMPITSIGEQGTFTIILDSEGNRVGLHAS